MSGQRDITLRSGHATPSTIVLRALPVATASTTTIYLYEGDATPSTIILRDPTTLAATGGAQSYTLTATPATLTLAGAVAALTVARRLTALPGALVLTGAEATLRVWRTLTALPGALTLTGGEATLTYTPGAVPVDEGGARPAGGWYDNTGWESLFLRPARDDPAESDERERVEAVAEIVADEPVEWSGAVPVFARPPAIDWGVARKIEARAESYDDSAMLDAMRRVIEAARRAQDEEDVAVLITLIH